MLMLKDYVDLWPKIMLLKQGDKMNYSDLILLQQRLQGELQHWMGQQQLYANNPSQLYGINLKVAETQNQLAGVNAEIARYGQPQQPQQTVIYQPQQPQRPQAPAYGQGYVPPQYGQPTGYPQQPQVTLPQYNQPINTGMFIPNNNTQQTAVKTGMDDADGKYATPKGPSPHMRALQEQRNIHQRAYEHTNNVANQQVAVDVKEAKPHDGHEFEPFVRGGYRAYKEINGNYYKYVVKKELQGDEMNMGNLNNVMISGANPIATDVLKNNILHDRLYNLFKANSTNLKEGFLIANIDQSYEVLIEKDEDTNMLMELFKDNKDYNALISKLSILLKKRSLYENPLARQAYYGISSEITNITTDVLANVIGAVFTIDDCVEDYDGARQIINTLTIEEQTVYNSNLNNIINKKYAVDVDPIEEDIYSNEFGDVISETLQVVRIFKPDTIIYLANEEMITKADIFNDKKDVTMRIDKLTYNELYVAMLSIFNNSEYECHTSKNAILALSTNGDVYDIWYNTIRDYFTISKR